MSRIKWCFSDRHGIDCDCMTNKEPKTTEQINVPQTGTISKTEIFNYDQCVGCKANIRQQVLRGLNCSACREAYRQQVIEEVEKLYASEKDCRFIRCWAYDICNGIRFNPDCTWWQQFKGGK